MRSELRKDRKSVAVVSVKQESFVVFAYYGIAINKIAEESDSNIV